MWEVVVGVLVVVGGGGGGSTMWSSLKPSRMMPPRPLKRDFSEAV